MRVAVFGVLAVLFSLGSCQTIDRDAQMYNTTSRAVVRIHLAGGQFIGTGVVLGERPAGAGCDVLVGTAAHVVDGTSLGAAAAADFALGSGDGPVSGSLHLHEYADAALAVFRTAESCRRNGYEPRPLARRPLLARERVFVSGFPLNHFRAEWGRVMLVETYVEGWAPGTIFSVAYPATNGLSGGPVFNEQAEVVGLVVGGFVKYPDLSFCVQGRYLRELIDDGFRSWYL